MCPALEFLSIMRPKRFDFLTTMTAEEKAVMERHQAYARNLFEQGKIIVGGVAKDGAIGILVLRVDSPDEAREIYDHDPAVQAEVGNTELHPFRLRMLAGPGVR